MESIWRKQTGTIKTQICAEEVIKKENHWDVIVIGAGLTGILTAYFLQEKRKRVLVIEADKIASGQTERTTAKITSQHGLKYSTLIRQLGKEKAKQYLQANEAAIEAYEQLIQKHGIECGFERVESYLYTRTNPDLIRKEVEAVAELGMETVYVRETELPFEVEAAVGFKNQAQFEPLAFVQGIAEQLTVLEDTRVTEVKGNWVISKYGILTAEQIVMTTHYPIKNIPGFYFLRQHQERSYAIALRGCTPVNHMYYGIDKDGISIRQDREYLIIGGESHRTGQKNKNCISEFERLENFGRQYFPDGEVAAKWAAQDCMPHDGVPFIGKYSVFTPNLYVATGFQKWGMSTAMVAAKLLCDMLCNKTNPYETLFTPQRLYFRAGIGNLFKDTGVSIKGLVSGLFRKNRCPHMGCKLVWNETEQSYDCPCHGSRFSEEGNLLDNPAKSDLIHKM